MYFLRGEKTDGGFLQASRENSQSIWVKAKLLRLVYKNVMYEGWNFNLATLL